MSERKKILVRSKWMDKCGGPERTVLSIEPLETRQIFNGSARDHTWFDEMNFRDNLTWRSDPPAFVPAKGDVVRVLEVAPDDAYPALSVGDVCEVVLAWARAHDSSYAYVRSSGDRHSHGTFCHVEKLPAIEEGSTWKLLGGSNITYTVTHVENLRDTSSIKLIMLRNPYGTLYTYYSLKVFHSTFTFLAPPPAKAKPRASFSPAFAAPPTTSKPAVKPALQMPTWPELVDILRGPCAAERLVTAANAIGPKALSLLADVAERLVKGKENGDFASARNWSKEAYEEELDSIVYRTLALRERL